LFIYVIKHVITHSARKVVHSHTFVLITRRRKAKFLLNLNFAKWTRAIVFADDLLIAIKAATVAEMENLTNMEMSKITKLSKENKLHFNNQSKLC